MTRRLLAAAIGLTTLGVWPWVPPIVQPAAQIPAGDRIQALSTDLDRIFSDPVLARALTAVRVDSLGRGGTSQRPQPLYSRNAERLVIPASNMKLITLAAAAETLGWDYRYETRFDAAGTIADGALNGDLIVTGSGDPTIGSPDGGHALQFLEWADALRRAGISRVNGRLIGDDNAFEDQGLGAGWAWDNLGSGYAAPVGALNYNENVLTMWIEAGAAVGAPAAVRLGPPGHRLQPAFDITTGPAGSTTSLATFRAPGAAAVTVSGRVPAGGPTVVRTAAVRNPTSFFVEALRLALESRGIAVTGGAWDIDELRSPPPDPARLRPIARRESAPLSALAGYAMKESQNFYLEAILKTMGRADDGVGTAAGGRRVIERTLAAWGIPADAVVVFDGSGLSRYNYATASSLVTILTHVWQSERLRGPFLATLPIAGRDGTLELRMRTGPLAGRVQAKTGTVSNVRALSGYLVTAAGERLAFSMIVNHFTAPSAAIDAVVERALERLVQMPPA